MRITTTTGHTTNGAGAPDTVGIVAATFAGRNV